MKVLVTGGHFSPALAVIQKLPKDTDVVYVGRKHPIEKDAAVSLEYQEITQRGIKFRIIQPGRLHRILRRNTPQTLTKMLQGFNTARKVIMEEQPDVVLSFGSYVALPICLVAYFKHIPIILHEQTFEAGLTTQLLSKFATKICVSWESSEAFFPKNKTLVTGNPAFSHLGEMKTKKPSNTNATLLITGGNQGSHIINETIRKILPELLKTYSVIHQTGDAKEFNDYDTLCETVDELDKKSQSRYRVEKFIAPDELNDIQAHADLVISRGGANTIGELFILNRPTIVIPIPWTQRDEQRKNAVFLAESGLAEIIEQDDLTPLSLSQTIHVMMNHIQKYTRKKDYEEKVHYHKTAAKTIADLTQEIGEKENIHF